MSPSTKSRQRARGAMLACLLVAVPGGRLLAQPVDTAARIATDPSPHRVAMATVDGVRVPYLDWGGSGPALVFFPGMGNSAHVFDEFAPRFTDRFRVVGVTRIGFGESDQPERDGYGLASRVAHILAALDSLDIARPVFVGHSLGGDEITAFAGAHPERVSGLIYLDAAIDHTVALRLQQELAELSRGAPEPSAADLADAQAFQQFVHQMAGVEFPIGEILAVTSRDSSGVVLGQRAGSHVSGAISAATVPPDFTSVQVPVLSLYSDYVTAADMFPWLQDDAAENARITAVLDERFRPELEAARVRFVEAVNGAQVFVYPAHHYQFLSAPDDTERRMRTFLYSLSAQ